MRTLLEKLFAPLTFMAVLLGPAIGALFVAAVLAGGATAESVTSFAGELMVWCVRAAAVAMAIGLVHMYLTGQHSLTAKTREPEAPDSEPGH